MSTRHKKMLMLAMCSAIAATGLSGCGATQKDASKPATNAATESAKPTENSKATDDAKKSNMPQKPNELTIWPDDNADKLAV
ncbi:hypothetical protein SD70_13650 [Gordoniibacillus kamchatkensis]|uniref:Uncharacterized protein n=1 Tax=Gordoniibacillus kamchatkensis TaxID=1590651 RepID=A0ABR5AHE7_9BACL|nr:hypothetical protein [Paenibacillus sp. VKM B-2647]KIL40449.1 hypothetical protein SD70_13650 [Paenibacillus sp. VKM B-2647]